MLLQFRIALRATHVLFAVLILSQAASRPAFAASSMIDRLEASVNSSLILYTDVVKFRRTMRLRSQLDPLFAGTTLAAKAESASNADIVQFLIDERLIAQAFPVNDAEVEQEINSIQSNNHIDRPQLRSALKDQGFSFDEYFELIRISSSKRNLIDRDIRTKVSVSDDDIRNYFYNHYAQGGSVPQAFHLQLHSVPTRDYKSPAAARDVALRALKAIRAGQAMEDAAKQFGGETSDLGTVTGDQMSSAIREQVKKLQAGQVSEVFGGPQAGAFFILKLLEVKTSESDRFEKMKEEIRGQLSASEFQHQISLWLERQRQTAFIHRAGEPATAGIPIVR